MLVQNAPTDLTPLVGGVCPQLAAIANRPLASIEAKHCAPGVDSPISLRLRRLASDVAYPFADIGADMRRPLDADRRYVQAMIKAMRIRPLKIVMTPCGRLWTDNTHWTLAALYKYGRSCALGETPHYLVRLDSNRSSMFNQPSSMGEEARREALHLAGNIQRRLEVGWRPLAVSYTVGELFEDGRYDTIR